MVRWGAEEGEHVLKGEESINVNGKEGRNKDGTEHCHEGRCYAPGGKCQGLAMTRGCWGERPGRLSEPCHAFHEEQWEEINPKMQRFHFITFLEN